VRLPGQIIQSVKKAGVEIFFAGRHTTKVWNSLRLEGEPMRYGGWYWVRKAKGRIVATDEDGPFKSESAAIRDAYLKLQIRV